MKIIIDSWAWIELFSKGPKADRVARELSQYPDVYVSVLNVFEVGRRLQLQFGEDVRKDRIAAMLQKALMLPLTKEDVFIAFRICNEHKLHTSDALIYATAVNHDAQLLTGDPHFKGKKGVIYVGD